MGKNNTELQIKFAKLSFTSTTLRFKSSSAKILNCFISDGEGHSVEFFPDQRQQTLFVENTTFTNNNQCIKIYSSKYSESGFKMVLIIKGANFISNCLRSNFTNGCIISIYDIPESNNLNSDEIVSSFTNLTFSENKGLLLQFNNSKGKFEGYHSNIRVMKNVHWERSSDGAKSSLLAITANKVNLSFVNVLYASNHRYRCLSIDARYITLSILHSRFVAQKTDGNGGVISLGKSHKLYVNIENTEFLDCRSYEGGVSYFSNENKEIHFIARNVSFIRCKANNSGGAISMYGNEATLLLENVTFIECMAAGGNGGGVLINVENVRFSSLYTMWKACGGAGDSFYGSALTIFLTTGNISIGHSNFDDDQLDPIAGVKRTLFIYASQNLAGSLEVYHSNFSNSHVAIWTIDTIAVNLTGVHFTRALNAALTMISNTLQSTAQVYVDRCVFRNSSGGIELFLQGVIVVKVTIKNSNFSKISNILDNAGGQAISILAKNVIEINSSISSFILFENLLVEENSFITLLPDAAVSVNLYNFFAREGNTVKIIKSRFIKNQNLETSTALNGKAGALLVMLPADNMTFSGCVDDSQPDIYRQWHYKNKVLIVNTSFENNIGVTGALYISNGDTKCINCLFKDNFATRRSGQIHISENSGKLALINSTLLETHAAASDFYFQNIEDENQYQKSTFIFSYSAGPLLITGTEFKSEISKQRSTAIVISKGGDLNMANQSLLLCPTGSKLVREDFSHFVATEYQKQPCTISVTVVTISCQVCPGGTYSLQRGYSTNMSTTTEGFYCFACPYGANCNRNIVAKTNFWGVEISHSPPQLEFATCPAGYCTTPNTLDTAVYNGCYGNREGKLCGKCKQRFTEELTSTSCIDQTRCDSVFFWSSLLLFSFLVALYLLLRPNIPRFIYRQIMWFKKQGDQENLTGAGYTKIIFYFYQIVGILLLETYMELIEKTKILSTIISAFSFHITFGSSKTIGCPFVGMTPITKVIFTNIGVLTIFLCICSIFIAHTFFCKVKGTCIEEIPYLAAILELLLLGYANITKASLKLLTCVTVGSESVLFLQGNTVCWQWWQVFLGIAFAFFMFPFTAVLYWGSKKYYERKLSPKEILLALVLPVPYIVRRTYRFIKTQSWNQSETTETEEEREECSRFTDVLYGPFRSPTDDIKGTLYWESVLVGRRLILLSIHALVVDPLLRMFLLTLTCVAVLYHHVLVFPFKERKANHSEAISLLVLVVISNINLCKAVLRSAGVTPIGPNLTHIKILEWTEVVLLALVPFTFAILLACFVISLVLRFTFILVQGAATFFSSLKTFIFVEEDRPLLAN